MPRPRATYRLQLTPDFGFAPAASMVDYLAALGVSHLYASPSLQAAPGSEHGYDVVDPTRLDESRGGEDAHRMLVAALREYGLGHVLDLVPNHMALVTPDNRWWWDVLARGRGSDYADYFDIDWASGRILLPVLGDRLPAVLDAGELSLVHEDGSYRIRYYEHVFPVADGTLDVADVDPDADPATVCATVTGDRDRLAALLDAQHYDLGYWRRANSELDYRRFFDIDTLGGVRVEDPAVFEATHRRILDLVAAGAVDGLRIDHPDGLRDPANYFQRLAEAAGEGIWIVIEKILEPGERPREDWPVAGTVGYEFCNLVLDLLVDPRAQAPLTDLDVEVTGGHRHLDAEVADGKRLALTELLDVEVERVTGWLHAVTDEVADRDVLREAVVETAVSFPVYRTYIDGDDGADVPVDPADAGYVDQAIAAARARRGDLSDALDLLTDVLLRRRTGAAATEVVMRFQQLTGPATAKGVEDTALYRYTRFVALNEVGGDPDRFGVEPGGFHAANEERLRLWPDTMLTTSSHDTKRSEDVRARLAVISEQPDAWVAAVMRWREMNAPLKRDGAPSGTLEYLLYQTLVGAWPMTRERLTDYLIKAAREQKVETSWLHVDETYEQAAIDFATALLEPGAFRDDLEAFVAGILEPGRINACTQALCKLTVPGVPDIYQGCELWDLSLVDPDNRRPVDFGRRRRLLDELADPPPADTIWARADDGLPKLWVTHTALQVRARHPEAFGSDGTYQALYAEGPRADHAVAFVRGDEVVTLVPRLVTHLGDRFGAWEWGATTLTLPDGRWHNVLDGTDHAGTVAVADLLGTFPVALLERATP